MREKMYFKVVMASFFLQTFLASKLQIKWITNLAIDKIVIWYMYIACMYWDVLIMTLSVK